MYLSEVWKRAQENGNMGTLELVSVGGDGTVVSGMYQSQKTVFGPGGMCWVPSRGQNVLVIKAGAEDCIAGVEMERAEEMEPGEVKFFTQGASVWLKNDGSILLEGRVLVNGKELEL